MSAMERVVFTNMCMVQDGKGNVVVQNRLNPNWPGITFPGGHVETGEPFTDAVIREVFEETGLTISQVQLCGVKDWMMDSSKRYVVLLYKTEVFSGDLVSSDEGEVMWVPLSELAGMQLAEGMENLLRVFLTEGLSEQFFYREAGDLVEMLK